EGDFGPYHVPEGCYFMMGDNRNKSLDARFWENTYVEKDAILGKVVLRYYKGFKIID
ncbi:S26 family signal peptidase, partial [Anaerotignum lactatifermentans]